jgi:hypothetical protein
MNGLVVGMPPASGTPWKAIGYSNRLGVKIPKTCAATIRAISIAGMGYMIVFSKP